MRLFTTSGVMTCLLLSKLRQTQALDNSTENLETFGWTAVPHSQHDLLKDVSPWDPANFTAIQIGLPESDLVTKTIQYAKEHLPSQTFNHSMRVYYYGMSTIHLVLTTP
jgi:cyanamide hydratase